MRTFEPGGWAGGAVLRSLLLDGDLRDARAELLLFLADRAGHVATVVRPALEAGRDVVCERYSDSTWAYQAGGRGLDCGRVGRLMDACGFPEPDLTVLLDIEPEEAAARLAGRGGADRIEGAGLEFMSRVARAYRERAAEFPGRILTISAVGTEDEVARRVEDGVEAFLGTVQGRKGESLP